MRSCQLKSRVINNAISGTQLSNMRVITVVLNRLIFIFDPSAEDMFWWMRRYQKHLLSKLFVVLVFFVNLIECCSFFVFHLSISKSFWGDLCTCLQFLGSIKGSFAFFICFFKFRHLNPVFKIIIVLFSAFLRFFDQLLLGRSGQFLLHKTLLFSFKLNLPISCYLFLDPLLAGKFLFSIR